MRRKVKICQNQQCENRVNRPDAAVCIGCGASFRGISWKILSEEEIQKALQPENIEELEEEIIAETKELKESVMREVIICPNCGAHVPYYVGIQDCSECGEYIQEEIPVREGENLPKEESHICIAKGMRTLDGVFYLEFKRETMEIGRWAEGQTYFENYGKRKVSRQHARVEKKEDGWHITYCRKTDRSYRDGIENPIFINGRELELCESYVLQAGDTIAFAELDMNDLQAAFFRVE